MNVPRSAWVLLAVALAGGCAGRKVPFTLLQGAPAGGCLSRHTEAVLRSGDEWERFWREKSTCPTPTPREVDFSRQVAVVYAMGFQNTGAVKLRLDGMSETAEGGVAVHLTITAPEPGCPVPMNVVYPMVVAVAPRAEGPVHFEVRHRRRRC
jgi:hypothetical protein